MTLPPPRTPTADEALLGRLIGGHPTAETEVVEASAHSASVGLLVAAGVLTGDAELLSRAAALAASARERQLVALARTHLDGPFDLFDALVRDHLASYPDQLLAAWLAGRRP